MLKLFEERANELKRIKSSKFWQDGNHSVELVTNEMMDERLNYIHDNPVKAGFVWEAENYVYSYAIDYSGVKGLLDIELID